jgi:hypothetical protein
MTESYAKRFARLGGRARAKQLSEERRREIAQLASDAAAARRATCEHVQTFTRSNGKLYCKSCRRRLSD